MHSKNVEEIVENDDKLDYKNVYLKKLKKDDEHNRL